MQTARALVFLFAACAAGAGADACAPGATGDAPKAKAPLARADAHPTIVVSIVIDQLAAWIAEERWPELPASGGFSRLLREGTYVRDARYAHAVTETAPGHATLYTGVPPRVHGVWGNQALAPGRRIPILQDDRTSLVGPDGITKEPGSSGAILRVETIADLHRARHPLATIVSVSGKDRGAIFAGGKQPTASLWYDGASGALVTSTAFARGTIPGLAYVGRSERVWSLSDADWVARHAGTRDDQDGEGDWGGLGVVFPHSLATATKRTSAYRATPFADADLLALAAGFATVEGARNGPELLAISLSANDFIGHAFGPDSWEAWEALRSLDAELGRFFAVLDARFGKDGWSAILTGDHGVVPMPEVGTSHPWCKPGSAPDPWQRPCVGDASRIVAEELSKELAGAAGSESILGVSEPYVFLSAKARASSGEERRRIDERVLDVLKRHPAVQEVIDVRDLPATCPPDDSVRALVCRSFVPGAAGDFYVVTRPGSFFDPFVVVGKGTSHGTPWLYDRSVPIVLRAPGRAAAGKKIAEPVPIASFTRALAELLGIDPPEPVRAAPRLLTAPDR